MTHQDQKIRTSMHQPKPIKGAISSNALISNCQPDSEFKKIEPSRKFQKIMDDSILKVQNQNPTEIAG